jgi:hypothetical protein
LGPVCGIASRTDNAKNEVNLKVNPEVDLFPEASHKQSNRARMKKAVHVAMNGFSRRRPYQFDPETFGVSS